MHYIRIKDEYIDFMKYKESRVPKQDYGDGKYKPFYILAELEGNDVLYVTQLTSPKERHTYLKDSLDFKKIFHPISGKLLGATNLNYMFPVLPEYIEHLSFNDLKKILNDEEKLKKLSIEKKELNKRQPEIKKSFLEIYKIKYEKPNSKLAIRSLDFKQLEANMLEFKLQKQFDRNDIQVERSNDHSTFFIHTQAEIYEYSESILKDIYGFISDMNDNIAYESDTNLNANNNLDI